MINTIRIIAGARYKLIIRVSACNTSTIAIILATKCSHLPTLILISIIPILTCLTYSFSCYFNAVIRQYFHATIVGKLMIRIAFAAAI